MVHNGLQCGFSYYRCLAEVPGLLEELALLEWHFLAKKKWLPNVAKHFCVAVERLGGRR